MSEPVNNTNFIRQIIDEDLASGKHDCVISRFPPEPNGYLHVGHVKSICLNFGLAQDYANSKCYLRFDDTNPTKEEVEYVESIKDDIHWLGFDWNELYFTSDYFEKLYEFAMELVANGKAYVCSCTPDEIKQNRGTLTEPGVPCPCRNSSIDENIELFERMKNGEFEDGVKVLRAKIDMASPNINLRDPVTYRVRKAHHHRTGDKWQIYPMYDFAHSLSDMIEGITHSLCTLEFEDHRPLYDWYVANVSSTSKPRQIEFARLNLTYTILSKRKLLQLVQEHHVDGWDDPRMPTVRGMRRRGYPPAALRNLCDQVGITKKDSIIDFAQLEFCVREVLDQEASRRMAVLNPLKVVITNYPEDKEETFIAKNHPKMPEMGEREIPFSREIYIERDDFMEEPTKKYFRLAPKKEVRLRYGYVIHCDEVIKDEKTGEIIELRCSYDPQTKGGVTPEGKKKVKGIIHWVSAKHAYDGCEVRLYDRLFAVENVGADKSVEFTEKLNTDSLAVMNNVKLEPSLSEAQPEERFQFERLGYFCVDRHSSEKMIFNRIVTLRDTWAKIK
jgi:glutaminyl-tRNA synthetase